MCVCVYNACKCVIHVYICILSQVVKFINYLNMRFFTLEISFINPRNS